MIKKEKAAVGGKERIISVIAAVLIPLPLMITSVVCSCNALRWQEALTLSGCGAAAWLMGQLLGFLLKKAGKKGVYVVRIGFALVGVGIVAVYETLFPAINTGSLAVFFMPIALCFWYWFGYRTGAGQDPVPYAVLGIYCIEAAVMFPLCGAFEEELHGGRNVILSVTAAVTVLGALIINNRQLNRISLRGKSDNRILSAASKKFNVKTTLIFSCILLFLFFFANRGAELLWEASGAIVRFLLYLLSLIPHPQSDYESNYGGELIGAEPALEEDNLIGRIISAIALAAVVALLIKPFIKGLKEIYRNIIKKLGRKAETEEITQYTDIYQVSDRNEFEKSSFKKALREFKKEKDSTRKYRAGYKAFMIYIGERSEQTTRGETTRVHLEKGRRLLADGSCLEQAVETYCKVRYDDYAAADGDINTMKNLLKSLY